VIALVVLFGIASAFTGGEYESAFTKWMVDNGKTYAPEEFFYRFEVFKSNMDFVDAWNSANHTSTVALNKFADLTSAEFALVYNGFKPELRREKKYITLTDLPQAYPDGSLDWSAKGVVTPVKDQGQCGSCWAFSTTGSVESVIAIDHGVLISLSEQELVDCAGKYGNYGCNGGLMDNAFKYVMANGLLTEQQYPYTAKNGICQRGSQAASQYSKISGYKDVTHTESALGTADDTEPISIAIEADQAAFQLYSGGIIKAGCGQNLDHGVLLVGYGTDTNIPYWKVKNSWGTSWGEAGYVRIERGEDLCGIANEPSYPVD
jgi:cathepsin L